MSTEEKIEIVLKTIGNCKFVETIGKSKLGTTYLVEHGNLGNCVLKLLKEDIFVTRKFLKSLRKYIDFLNETSHPSIAKVYKISEEPFPYLFRKYVKGRTLKELIQGNPSPAEATLWMEKLTVALQAAYNFGVSHKNLKPGNVFLTDNNLAVVDFCLPASLSYYLSPEHCNNQRRDFKSDIYSLGIIYYQALTGDVPFHGKFREVKQQHLEKDWPPIPEIPIEIDNILQKTLAKQPEDRYSTLLALLHDLRKARKIFTDKHGKVNSKVTFAMPKIQKVEIQEEREDIENQTHDDISLIEEDTLYNYSAKNLNFIEKEERQEKEEKYLISNLQDFDKISLAPQQEYLKGIDPITSDLPDFITQSLLWISDTRDILDNQNNQSLEHFVVNFDKKYQDAIYDYLNQFIRCECWSIKNTSHSEILQLVVNLSDAKIFRYYNFFDEKIRTALKKLPQDSSINRTFFTQVGSSSSTSKSKSASRASFFSILDTILSLKDDEVKVFDENDSENYQTSESKKNGESSEKSDEKNGESSEDNWLNVDENIGENIRKFSEEEAKKEIDSVEEIEVENEIEMSINFNNRYQASAWFRLIRENGLEPGKHFQLKQKQNKSLKRHFLINLTALHEYQKQQEGLSSVQAFFQSDYNIERLDHGGMATVLKLIAKNDITIIFLRPENQWAREYFGEHLRIRKTKDGKEGVYAEMPLGTVVVVKVAFEGREEALIYESRLLSKLAEAKNIRKYIIGMIQEGSFLAAAADSQVNEERVGYYLMLEYASYGNIEQFSKCFPYKRLPPSIAFNVLYTMTLTLQFLKSEGIIHRDIKPQNILMSNNLVPKLGDFGLAITVDDAGSKLNDERRRLLKLVDQEFLNISSEKEQSESRLQRLRDRLKNLSYPDENQEFEEISLQITELKTQIDSLVDQELERADDLKKRYRPMSAEEIAVKGEFAGSMVYAAPEQFSPSKILTCDCDIYQLGAVSYTMLTGKLPVQGKNISAIMSEIILSHKPKVSDEIKDSPVVEALSDLVYDMMTNDVTKRISIDDIRKQLEKIMLNHFHELQKTPYFQAPKEMKQEDKEKWQEQIVFAQNTHEVSAQYIVEWHEQLQQETRIHEKQKQDGLEIINLWWEGNNKPKNFRFRCPGCSKNLKMPSGIVGKKIRCPHCQLMFMAKRFS